MTVPETSANGISPNGLDPVKAAIGSAFSRESIKLKEAGLSTGFKSDAEAEKVFQGAVRARAINKEIDRQADQILAGQSGRRLREVTADQITPRRVRWAVDLGGVVQIALGKITLLAGYEGAAKSLFTLWMAARITCGDMPGDLRGYPRRVVIVSREDDWHDTILPRLMAAGARRELVSWVRSEDGELSLPADMREFEDLVNRRDVSLVVLDPIVSAFDSKMDSHKQGDVRNRVEPLAQMAARTRCAVCGIIHFSKADPKSQRVMSLVGMSGAFKDVARGAVAFAREEGTDDGLVKQLKNSVGRDRHQAMEYRIGTRQVLVEGELTEQPVFEPGALTDRDIKELLGPDGSKLRDAELWLQAMLIGGYKPSSQIQADAQAAGISEKTLMRARKSLGIKADKAADGVWYMHY